MSPNPGQMPPNPGVDPSGDRNQEPAESELVHLKPNTPAFLTIRPDSPESRAPLSEQTIMMKQIGYQDVEVVGVVGLSPDARKEGAGNDYNIWVILDTETGIRALVNGDAAAELANNGASATEDYAFQFDFMEPLSPGEELTIGRGHKTLGFDLTSEGDRETEGMRRLSSKHVKIGMMPGAKKGYAQLEITDLESTNGTSLLRGEQKSVNRPTSLIEMPDFPEPRKKTELRPSEMRDALVDIEAEVSDPKYADVKELRDARKKAMTVVERTSYGVNESARKASMDKVRAIDAKLRGEYYEIQNNLMLLESNQRQLQSRLRKAEE